LAALIFHELAHNILYVSDHTTFNESFATAVEQEGIRRWLTANNNPSAIDDYMIDSRRHFQFIKLIMKYRKKLESLYSKDISLQQKREAKESTFNDLKDEYKVLKEKWQGYSGYDFWFSRKMNNARMITVSTYYDLVPAFIKIMEASGNDMEKFYKKCQELAEKPKEERLSLIKKHHIKEFSL
jgi:predicted aminopeptidase